VADRRPARTLALLKAGWLDGDGEPVPQPVADAAQIIQDANPELDLLAFPTQDADASLEAAVLDGRVSVRVSADHTVEVDVLHGSQLLSVTVPAGRIAPLTQTGDHVRRLEREVARLRGRTHEIQAAEMAKRARMEARLAHYDNLRDQVRLWLPRVGAGSSIFNLHQAIELQAQLDAARQEADDLHRQLDALTAQAEGRHAR